MIRKTQTTNSLVELSVTCKEIDVLLDFTLTLGPLLSFESHVAEVNGFLSLTIN